MCKVNCTNCHWGQWSLFEEEKEKQVAKCNSCFNYSKWEYVREVEPDERG